MKKRILAVLLSFCITDVSFLCPVMVQAEGVETDVSAGADDAANVQDSAGLDAEYHTQEQIRDYYKSHPVKDMEAEYITEPSVTVPYAAGELTEETKQDALNTLNLYRYIAGVPEVAISDKAQKYAQAAALVNAINRRLEHTPACPAGMDKELYDLAVFGAFNSNLAALGNRLSDTIHGYMLEKNGDADFGHRRQLLDYHYDEAGFGFAQSSSGGCYSATYVDANMKEDKAISYPGQNQPLEYFGTGYAWTVIIPEQVDKSAVNIKLTDMKTGYEWNFNQSSKNLRLDDFAGRSACAIFSPYGINYRDGDQYKVEITGIEKPITYEVNMFYLKDTVPLTSMRFQWSECSPFEGEDHYMCRLNFIPENATNQIVEWSSSNPDIAEAVWAGTGICRIIAKKAGTAVITATSEDGGHTATMKVSVRKRASGVQLDKTEITIGVGQFCELSGKALPEGNSDMVHYKSDYDRQVIKTETTTIGGRIKVTGLAVGQTELHAYPYSNPDVCAVCRVNVVEPVYTEELRLDADKTEIKVKESIPLNTVFSPSNVTCRELEWKTSNSNVKITKSKDGQVTATGVNLGQSVITAKALDGSNQTASYTVTVYSQYEKMEKPAIQSYTSDKVVLKSVSGCEYSMDQQNWQDSNEFTNLQPDHEYIFYIRKKGTGYIKAGETSEGTVVKTRIASDAACRHKNTVVKNASKATCTEKGYTGDTYCADCQKKIASGKATSALGHNYTSKAENGDVKYTCTRCGDSYIKTGSSENGDGKTPADSGSDHSGRAEGNTAGTDGVDLPDESGTGEEDITEGDVFTSGSCKYEVNHRFELVFTGFAGNQTSSVKIPDTLTINGQSYKVTSIEDGAFENSKVKNVTIGRNVKVIGDSAFKGCGKLRKVTLGSSVTKIGKNAFKGCGKLSVINIRSAKLKTVGRNAFKGISKSAKIKVPSKKLSAYKKLLKNKGQDKKVKITK